MSYSEFLKKTSQTITSIQTLCYLFNDDGVAEIQELIVYFENDYFVFSCDAVGETLQISQKLPQPVDMGEYGKTEIHDCSDAEYKKYIGNKILKIFLWKNQFGIECGIELNFSNGELLIFNMGDDLMIYEAQPDFLVSEGYVRFE